MEWLYVIKKNEVGVCKKKYEMYDKKITKVAKNKINILTF